MKLEDRRADCGHCGRNDVSYRESYESCDHVNCPVFAKFNRIEKESQGLSERLSRFADDIGGAFSRLFK